MRSLIKYEFHQLFRSKSLYICAVILALVLLCSILTVNFLINLADTDFSSDTGVTVEIGSGMDYSGKYFILSALAGDATMILAAAVTLFVCRDFSSGTIRNIVARGYSRKQIFLSKLLAACAAALLLCLVCWLVPGAVASALWGFGGAIDLRFAATLAAQTVIIIGFASMFFTVAICLKKTGGALAINMVAPAIISALLSLMTAAIGSESLRLEDYWLSGCLTSISVVDPSNSLLIRSVLCGSVCCLVFLGIGFAIHRKSEV